MSVVELKEQIQSLSAEDKVYLAAWLKHLSRVDATSHQAELKARLDAARDGQGHSLEQLERIHASLTAEGM
ncbi:MAG: hypothetical protein HY360_24705 [Verrucomicrobia bacterium]|nr:hypothetical protein [Verrucomicrobiota bacterium]